MGKLIEAIRCVVLVLGCLAVAMELFTQDVVANWDNKSIKSSKYWLGIQYVEDRLVGHRLDIHLPYAEADVYPVVICIYGSAWFSDNSKANTFKNGVGQALLDAGFAVVSINHRSSPDNTFPAQIHDVKAAIRFVRSNAESFSLDTSFIGITGWSSGGHLSALAGTTSGLGQWEVDGVFIDLEGQLGSHVNTSSRVDAVVNWFGPTDFLIMDDCGSSFSHNAQNSPESSLIGGPIQENIAKSRLADPASYVSKDDPPMLIIHGDEDPLVPHCQSEHLQSKLGETGSQSILRIIAGGKHGPGVMTKENYALMIDFLKTHMNVPR